MDENAQWKRKNIVSLTAYWSWDMIDKAAGKETNAILTDCQLVMESDMIN